MSVDLDNEMITTSVSLPLNYIWVMIKSKVRNLFFFLMYHLLNSYGSMKQYMRELLLISPPVLNLCQV